MKKIRIMGLCIIILIVGLITILINKNNQKYIMYDGMLLALTVDGEVREAFPERGEYSIRIDCGDTAIGRWLAEEWKLAVENITGKVSCSVSFTTNPSTLKTTVETVNVNQNYDNNGYRYSGKSPNNWVWFNNEKWRIIGSIPTKQSDGTTSNLVKIIRNSSIGTYSYDAKESGYTGEWGKNTLYSLLNTHYYATNKDNMNGQSHAGCYSYYGYYKTKPDCDYSEIGILSDSYYGRMVKNVYWNTGESYYTVTPRIAYISEKSTQTVLNYVGLMTGSDWGYAADSSYHNLTIDKYTSSSNDATTTNWIYNNGDEWTSVQNENSISDATFVRVSGYAGSKAAYYGYAVRPVVYLDAEVYVISGTGSEEDPYVIGIQ